MREPPAPPREGLVLDFSDDFDGPELDPRWATTYPDGSRKLDRELQTYRDRGDPAFPFRFSDGVLSIMASAPASEGAPYASGLLSSHDSYSFMYGYAEIRARVPAGQGLWPAFWMFRNNDGVPYGEIDVLELLGGRPDTVYATLHAGPEWKGRAILQTKTVADEPYSDGFHTFAVDWRQDETAFLIDGKEVGRFPTPQETKAPMHLRINLAVGGPWGGPPEPATPFPSAFEVDWVRVWRAPPP